MTSASIVLQDTLHSTVSFVHGAQAVGINKEVCLKVIVNIFLQIKWSKTPSAITTTNRFFILSNYRHQQPKLLLLAVVSFMKLAVQGSLSSLLKSLYLAVKTSVISHFF
ncbi:GPI mannosyltransferase 3 [Bienertia sinuspersici]